MKRYTTEAKKATKSSEINNIINLINTVYSDESTVNKKIKKALHKLDIEELSDLKLMIDTSK